MSKSGNYIVAVVCLLLTAALPALAKVDAQVDRGQVYLGDSLRLTLTSDDGEDVGDTDLEPILQDFEILERSTSSNFSLVNGKRTSTRELRLELTPRRTGELRIPPLDVDGQRTRELRVIVSEAPELDTGGQTVIFEAEVDRTSVYVQGQLILTLRLSQAINLDGRSITEFELDNAFVKQLEQNSFQRRIDGRPWLIHEVRYAIFPEQSGTLEIPAQTFSGRIREARRSPFDMGRGRLIRRNSEPIAVTVIPRPDEYPDTTWLPARRVDLIEEWSAPPEQLKAGESVTRTVRIVGEGLQGAQLPPVLFTPVDGLKFYPDQPQISDREVTSGLQGVRTDSAAIVPTRAGNFEIPELRVPWWDTQREQLRYAVLPGRTLQVAAAPGTAGAGAAAPAIPAVPAAAPDAGTGNASATLWQVIALVSAAGWLATLVALWHLYRTTRPVAVRRSRRADAGERDAFRAALAACKENDARRARDTCIRWAATQMDAPHLATLDAVAAYFDDAGLGRELAMLDKSLYAADGPAWRGDGLARCLQSVRAARQRATGKRGAELALYPDPA